ncbi:MAG TPA: FtsX-like permease family protein, partial [Ilumatobacteraceae bacterium]|nr:FtsX-like permease family protein [Ilumatobacteraceae bacterium]
FAAAAYWDPSFSERPLNDLLADLTAEPNAAIVVGRVPTADGVLRYKKSADGRQVHAVARLDVFPTMRNNKPLVVITRDTAHASEFLLSRDVLARGKSQAQWMDNLRAAGTAPVWSITPDMVVDSSQMLFAQWTFVFVRALGVFVGALVIVALLLQLVARQRQQTIAVGILRRMGVDRTRQALALLTEIAILGSVMIVAGVAAALFVARVVVPRLDPLPAIAPPPLNILPTAMIAALIGVAAVSAVVGALIAQASAARANLAEALRDE